MSAINISQEEPGRETCYSVSGLRTVLLNGTRLFSAGLPKGAMFCRNLNSN